MDLDSGRLVIETAGDSQKVLNDTAGTEFLSFDIGRRTDLQNRVPNMLSSSETLIYLSVLDRKVEEGLGHSSFLQRAEARSAAQTLITIARLGVEASIQQDTAAELAAEVVQQVNEALTPPSIYLL
jgi:hypothetical protein